MNAVIWARVSSREQREGYSIDAQLRLAREKAQREGWTVAREFAIAESARKGVERKAYQEMVAWVQKNGKRQKINVILSHKLDRICRNIRDAVRMQEMEDKYGIKLAFVDNEFGPGAAGMLSFNVMAAVAQYYSDNLRTEVQKGILEKVQQGWAPGLAAYGYYNHGDDKEEPIKVEPQRSLSVRRIFELYAHGGHTFKTLADQLEREGHIYRPSQPQFNRTALSYILNNRFYVGEVQYRGKQYPGKHRPLISMALFGRCQEILQGKNRRISSPRIGLSGGLFRCSYCGFSITGEQIKRKLKSGGVRKHIYYRCANNNPPPGHPKVRWTEKEFEQKIAQELQYLAIPNEDYRLAFEKTLEVALADSKEYTHQQIRIAKKRLSEIQTHKDRLLTAFLGGIIDETTFQNKTTKLTTETKNLTMTLEMTNQERKNDQPKNLLSLFGWSQNIKNYWKGSNYAQKRQLLEIVSLNRLASDVSLFIKKSKPFDILAKSPVLEKSRRDRI